MKIRNAALPTLLCLALLFVGILFSSCDRLPSGYKEHTYNSLIGGCGLYTRTNDKIEIVHDTTSVTGISNPGSKITIPKCASWGVIAFTGMITESIPEWKQNRVPELMILDDAENPRISDEDLVSLSELKDLVRLDLSFCPKLTDTSLNHLSGMNKIRSVLVSAGSTISETALTEFRKQHPKAIIRKGSSDNMMDALNEK